MSISRIEIDGDGDVQLRVGSGHKTTPITFTACSRALSRASSVFEDIFYGDGDGKQLGNAAREQARRIELPHDEPASLALLLYIIHSRFDHVPERLSVEYLYKLVVVAHKYSAAAALRPWTVKWTRSPTFETETNNELEMLKAMGIYWVLGCREDFFRTTRCFAESTQGLPAADLAAGPIPLDVIGECPPCGQETRPVKLTDW